MAPVRFRRELKFFVREKLACNMEKERERERESACSDGNDARTENPPSQSMSRLPVP